MVESHRTSVIGARGAAGRSAPLARSTVIASLLAGAAMVLATPTAALDVGGVTQTVGGQTGSFNILNTGSPATLTISTAAGLDTLSGSIDDTGIGGELTIIKAGNGAQYFIGTGTYSGGTELAGGILGFGTSTALGTGLVEFTGSNATLLAVGANLTLANNILLTSDGHFDGDTLSPIFTGQISGPGTLVKTGNGSIRIDNTGNNYAATEVQQGSILIGNSDVLGLGSITFVGNGGLNAVGTQSLSNNIVLFGKLTSGVSTSVLTLTGGISGTAGIDVTGGATLNLTGSNSFIGNTQIFANSTIGIADDNAFGIGSTPRVITQNEATVRALANGLVVARGFRMEDNLNIDTNGNFLTITGRLVDLNASVGGLTVIGGGTLRLTNSTNSYTGDTDVLSGTLQLDGTLAAAGVTTIWSGSRLTGTGTALGFVQTDIGASINPGDIGVAGTLTVGSLSLSPGTNLDFDLGTASDLLAVTNGVTLGGVLNVNDLAGFGAGTYTLLTYGGTLGGQSLTRGLIPLGYAYGVSTATPNQVNLIVALGGETNQYWNGTTQLGDGTLHGGNGTWNAANTNWATDNTGAVTEAWNGVDGVFGVTGGTVTVVGNQSFNRLAFDVDGYTLTGGALTATGGTSRVTVAAGTLATIASNIGGAGALYKYGAGTLTLSGTNTYSSSSFVAEGTLNLTGSIAADQLILAGATLTGTGTTSGFIQLQAGSIFSPGVNAGDTDTFAVGGLLGNPGSSFNFDLVGAGDHDQINVNGTASISGATFNFFGPQALGTYTLLTYGTSAVDEGSLLTSAAPVGYQYIFTDTGTALQLEIALLGGGTFIYWDGGNTDPTSREGGTGTWSNAGTNWATLAGNANAAWDGIIANFGTSGGTVTVVGGKSFTNLNFTANGYVLNGATLTANGGADISVSGVNSTRIENQIAVAALTKSGTGKLVLAGANSFAALTVLGGSVGVSNASSLGAGTAMFTDGTSLVAEASATIGNGLTLAAPAGSVVIDSAGRNLSLTGVIDGTGALFAVNNGGASGLLTLADGNTYIGGTVVSGSVVRITADSGLGNALGDLALEDGTLITSGTVTSTRKVSLNVSIDPASVDTFDVLSGTTTLNGKINGSGLLVKQGDGTLVLGDATNSFTGGVRIQAGSVDIASNGALGSGGALVFAGTGASTLRFLGAVQISGRPVSFLADGTIDTNGFDGGIGGGFLTDGSPTAGLIKTGAGELSLGGASSGYLGGLRIIDGEVRLDNDESAGSGKIVIDATGGTSTLIAGNIANEVFSMANAFELFGPATIDLAGSTVAIDYLGNTAFSGTTLGIAGVIGGTGSLTVQGGGAITLDAMNTYTGGTTLKDVVAHVTNDKSLGDGTTLVFEGFSDLLSSAPSVTLGADITLNGIDAAIGGAGNLTLTGSLTGASTLYKVGSGTLTLTGDASGKGGDTYIGDGKLVINGVFGDGNGTVTAKFGGILGGSGTINADVFIEDGIYAPGNSPATQAIVGNLTIAAATTLQFELGDNTQAGGAFNDYTTVSGDVVLDGTLDVFDPGLPGAGLTSGLYTLIKYEGAITDNILAVGSVDNGLFAAVIVNTVAKQVNLFALGASGGGALYWDGTDQGLVTGVQGGTGTWDAATFNWANQTGTANINWQQNTDAFFTANAGTVTIDGDQGFNSLTFAIDGYDLVAGTGGLDSSGSGLVQVDTGTTQIHAAIDGLGGLAKTGAGELDLYAKNTYAGATSIAAGTVGVFRNDSLGNGLSVVTFTGSVADAPTLRSLKLGVNLANDMVIQDVAYIDSGVFDFGLNGEISGPGTLIKTGSGTLGLTNTNSFAALTIDVGTVRVNSDAAMGAAGGTVTFNGNGATLAIQNNFSTDSNRRFVLNGAGELATIDTGGFTYRNDGVVSGAGTLVKTGTGTLVLGGAAANTYTGGTNLTAGTIQIATGSGLGTGTLTATGGTTLITGLTSPATMVLANDVALNGPGALHLDLMGGPAIQFDTVTALFSGGTPSAVALTGQITGTGGLDVVGGTAGFANLTIGGADASGANSYSGGTTLTRTIVAIGAGDALGTGDVTLAGFGGIANNSGFALTVANNIDSGSNTIGLGGASDLDLQGVVAGQALMLKLGADRLTFSNEANSFSGGILAFGGEVRIDGAFTSLTATMVLNGGTTLSGTGSFAGGVTIADGASINPGDSPGTLTVGDLSLAAGAILNYELGAAGVVGDPSNDLIVVNDDLVLDGLLNVTDSGGFGLGVYNLISYGGDLVDNGLDINALPIGFTGSIETGVAHQVNLVVAGLGVFTQYWDGADAGGDGVVNGGSGTWSSGNTNWTSPAFAFNSTWQSGIGLFAGTAGTATLVDAQSFIGLGFLTDGYTVAATGAGELQVNGSTFLMTGAGVTATITAPITGTGNIEKQGAGNLVLDNANTGYSGDTTVTAGILTLGDNVAAGSGGIALGNGTTLAALTSGLNVSNALTTLGASVDAGPAGSVFTLSGLIDGSGSLTKINTGELRLDGPNNSFSGGLVIDAGQLTLGATGAQGTGLITINDGAILAAGVSGLDVANAVLTTGGGRVDQGTGVFTLSGTIGGATGSISAIGSGILELMGNNSFNDLGINNGTVKVFTDTAAGLGTIALNGGTILAAGVSGLTLANTVITDAGGRIDQGTGVFTLAGNIAGAGSISAIGSGILELKGNNSFGDLGINQGTVKVFTNTAAGLGTIALNGGTILAAGVSGLTVANTLITDAGGRIDQGTGVFTMTGNIAGAGSISAIGSGILELKGNNSFGDLGINQGTVKVFTDTAAGIGTIALNGGTILSAGADDLVVANTLITDGGGRIEVAPADFDFTMTANIAGAGSISKIGLGNLNLKGNNSFGDLGINQGTVTVFTDTAAGLGTIALNGGAILAAGISGLTVTNTMITTGGGRVDQGTGVFTLTGNIAGAGSISAIGTGILELKGSNSFGDLGINQGTVKVFTNTAAGLGTIALNGGTILSAGADDLVVANTLITDAGGRIEVAPAHFDFTMTGNIAGAGSISKIGLGNLNLKGNNSFGDLGINQGTVTVFTDTAAGLGTIAINGGALLAAGVSGLTVANSMITTGDGFVSAGTGMFTLSGNIAGAGSLTQIGSGNLLLTGTNSFTGGLSIDLGTVTLGNATAPGTGTIVIGGGTTLAAGASMTLANAIVTPGAGSIDTGSFALTLDGVISGVGSITKLGSGNLNLRAANTFGDLFIDEGRATVFTNTAAGLGVITIAGGATLAQDLQNIVLANTVTTTGDAGIDQNGGIFTLSGVIGGSGSLRTTALGTLVLNGANSFSGGVFHDAGTLRLGTNTAAGTGVITLAGGSRLEAGATNLVVGNDMQTLGTALVSASGTLFTLTGSIGGAGGLDKVDSGDLKLTGTSNYLGATTVSQGKLIVTGALTNSTVTVRSGAILGGTGTVHGLVVQAGGFVTPGQSVGTLHISGPVTFAAGSTYAAEILGATSGLIAATGAATLNGASLTLNGSTAPSIFGTTYTLLTAAGGRTGTFTPTLTGFSQAFKPTFLYGANDVRLRLDPASIAGLLGSGAGGSSNILNFAEALDVSVAAGFNPQHFFPIYL